MNFQNVTDLSKVRQSLLFESLLSSSSCLITKIETSVLGEIFDMIDMVNDFRVSRKHLLVLTPTFNETMLKNITINYDVTIEYINEGGFHVIA